MIEANTAQAADTPTLATQDATSSRRAGLRGWLWRAPVDDPVDRRNAPMLQVVLLLLGCVPPLMWLYRALLSAIPWRPGEVWGMATSLTISVVALFGVLLIRRGHFQWAIRQMLVLVAAAMIFAYATKGSTAQVFEQPLQVVWMVLAGLMIGRRALWLMYGCVLVAYIAGGLVDAGTVDSPLYSTMNVTMSILINSMMFLLIAVVIDRSVRALRESLDDATRRGNALALANRRLEIEMSEREKVQHQLIHAQKVEAVGRLASGVAHDFNHLLALILGYAAKGRTIDDSAELKKALGGVEAAGRRATAVTHKLLSFSRQDETRIERFDLGGALQDLQPMLRQLFDPRVRIVCEVPETAVQVEFDRAQFDLVVLNIAANANHAMPEGGRFDILLREPDGGPHIELDLRDNGHGMSAEVRERLFEPFFTTKPADQGTGLGLSVAKDLIVAHGGSIVVESQPGSGTTFRIRLPALVTAHADA